MSADSGQGDSLSTPRRAQKCLFGSGNSSNGRTLLKNQSCVRGIEASSEEESDLGPMSPLDLTDHTPSTCCSSPGRDYISPFASPKDTHKSNDKSGKNNLSNGTSPFSALKKSTRAARYSPRRKIFPDSPKSLSCSPMKAASKESTPKDMEKTMTPSEIVPETPPRSFGREIQNEIVETPRSRNAPENRLITPLGSASKLVELPRLHRRKSGNVFDTNASSSPERKENTLKRHAHDTVGNVCTKLLKTDEACSIPKARAALFQEKKTEHIFKNFTLSAKTFYGNHKERMRPMSFGITRFNGTGPAKRRRSLPLQSNNRRSLKKHKFSGINAGVFHKIKKPKPKSNTEVKKDGNNSTQSPKDLNADVSEVMDEQEMEMYVTQESNTTANKTNLTDVDFERSSLPEIDPTKRFFKTKRTLSTNCAVVTVNDKIKLKVTNGKIVLNQTTSRKAKPPKNIHKRPKLTDVSFDTTDLTVDEPEIEASIEKSEVANILKVLEDDWANDEYDTLETLTNQTLKTVISPLKSVTIPKDVAMSPASELSNMTSIMNIEDVTASPAVQDIYLESSNNNGNITETEKQSEKYPVFTKGYTARDMYDETNTKRGTKRGINWQLSAKGAIVNNQYQLDVGQKHFGATQCSECNIVYQIGDPEDENTHLNYHNSIHTLKFQGWKTENVLMEDPYTQSRVISVKQADFKQHWKKVTDILEVVDRDLGLSDMKAIDYQNKTIYLYVRNKSVIGVLVAEYIKNAHRMIPELLELDCCTAESTPAKCGINVVWTAMSHRRQGIATKLVDLLRTNFYYGYVMTLDDIAFSIPTPSGKIFAEKYTKTRNFKVYS